MVATTKTRSKNNILKGLDKETLSRLDQHAIDLIEHQLSSSIELIKDKPKLQLGAGIISLAQWVYEQNHGKAKQAIEAKTLNITAQLTQDQVLQHLNSIQNTEFELLNTGNIADNSGNNEKV